MAPCQPGCPAVSGGAHHAAVVGGGAGNAPVRQLCQQAEGLKGQLRHNMAAIPAQRSIPSSSHTHGQASTLPSGMKQPMMHSRQVCKKQSFCTRPCRHANLCQPAKAHQDETSRKTISSPAPICSAQWGPSPIHHTLHRAAVRSSMGCRLTSCACSVLEAHAGGDLRLPPGPALSSRCPAPWPSAT